MKYTIVIQPHLGIYSCQCRIHTAFSLHQSICSKKKMSHCYLTNERMGKTLFMKVIFSVIICPKQEFYLTNIFGIKDME